ncbi:MAG: DNA polymerase III subunit chi [Rickettsiella sp.]|nr:DNA polymerase III subunit chi [Rickettsiella sp.]
MSNVNFYLLNTSNQEDVYRVLCRLVDKAYQQQHQAFIHTNSLEEAKRIDDLLWTFRDISFIPHQIGETTQNHFPVPITIDFVEPKQDNYAILFNLTHEVPHFFLKFLRIIEIVPEEKIYRTRARRKYKDYKEKNCSLTTHTISLSC